MCTFLITPSQGQICNSISSVNIKSNRNWIHLLLLLLNLCMRPCSRCWLYQFHCFVDQRSVWSAENWVESRDTVTVTDQTRPTVYVLQHFTKHTLLCLHSPAAASAHLWRRIMCESINKSVYFARSSVVDVVIETEVCCLSDHSLQTVFNTRLNWTQSCVHVYSVKH